MLHQFEPRNKMKYKSEWITLPRAIRECRVSSEPSYTQLFYLHLQTQYSTDWDVIAK